MGGFCVFLGPLRDGWLAARRDAATTEDESGARFDVRFFAMMMGFGRRGLTLRVGAEVCGELLLRYSRGLTGTPGKCRWGGPCPACRRFAGQLRRLPVMLEVMVRDVGESCHRRIEMIWSRSDCGSVWCSLPGNWSLSGLVTLYNTLGGWSSDGRGHCWGGRDG